MVCCSAWVGYMLDPSDALVYAAATRAASAAAVFGY